MKKSFFMTITVVIMTILFAPCGDCGTHSSPSTTRDYRQDIISCNVSSYLKKILDSGFDGVYLDIIDAFEYFENQ